MLSRLYSLLTLAVAPPPSIPYVPSTIKKREVALNEAGEEVIIEYEITNPLKN